MIPLKVLGNRVLIRPDVSANAPDQVASGLYVAKSLAAAVTGEDATTSVCRGTVIAVGTPRHPLKEVAEDLADRLDAYHTVYGIGDSSPVSDGAALLRDVVRVQPCCAVGDDVLFSHDAGQEIAIDGDVLLLLKDDELLAVVEPEREIEGVHV